VASPLTEPLQTSRAIRSLEPPSTFQPIRFFDMVSVVKIFLLLVVPTVATDAKQCASNDEIALLQTSQTMKRITPSQDVDLAELGETGFDETELDEVTGTETAQTGLVASDFFNKNYHFVGNDKGEVMVQNGTLWSIDVPFFQYSSTDGISFKPQIALGFQSDVFNAKVGVNFSEGFKMQADADARIVFTTSAKKVSDLFKWDGIKQKTYKFLSSGPKDYTPDTFLKQTEQARTMMSCFLDSKKPDCKAEVKAFGEGEKGARKKEWEAEQKLLTAKNLKADPVSNLRDQISKAACQGIATEKCKKETVKDFEDLLQTEEEPISMTVIFKYLTAGGSATLKFGLIDSDGYRMFGIGGKFGVGLDVGFELYVGFKDAGIGIKIHFAIGPWEFILKFGSLDLPDNDKEACEWKSFLTHTITKHCSTKALTKETKTLLSKVALEGCEKKLKVGTDYKAPNPWQIERVCKAYKQGNIDEKDWKNSCASRCAFQQKGWVPIPAKGKKHDKDVNVIGTAPFCGGSCDKDCLSQDKKNFCVRATFAYTDFGKACMTGNKVCCCGKR